MEIPEIKKLAFTPKTKTSSQSEAQLKLLISDPESTLKTPQKLKKSKNRCSILKKSRRSC